MLVTYKMCGSKHPAQKEQEHDDLTHPLDGLMEFTGEFAKCRGSGGLEGKKFSKRK